MKRTPLQRKTPLRAKAGLKGSTIKAKRKPAAPADEKRHMARVAAMPCLVSGRRPVQVHHVTAPITGGRIARSNRRIVPLAFEFHKIEGGKLSVEELGHAGFYREHRIDLLAVSDVLWAESVELEGKR